MAFLFSKKQKNENDGGQSKALLRSAVHCAGLQLQAVQGSIHGSIHGCAAPWERGSEADQTDLAVSKGSSASLPVAKWTMLAPAFATPVPFATFEEPRHVIARL